jgi:hypothetical protein
MISDVRSKVCPGSIFFLISFNYNTKEGVSAIISSTGLDYKSLNPINPNDKITFIASSGKKMSYTFINEIKK